MAHLHHPVYSYYLSEFHYYPGGLFVKQNNKAYYKTIQRELAIINKKKKDYK